MKNSPLIYLFVFLGINTAVSKPLNETCSAPTRMSMKSLNSTLAVLEWAPVSGISKYTIRYHKAGVLTWEHGISGIPSFRVTGLSPNMTYECQVQTVCSDGSSPFTDIFYFTTLRPPMNAPTAVAANSLALNSATLTWTAVTGGCNYQIQWRSSASYAWNSVSGIVTSPFNLNGLSSCTRYEFRVRAICPGESSAYSIPVSFTTTCPVSNPNVSTKIMKDENESTMLITMYPNPVHENLAIEYNSSTSGTVSTIVYNMIGKNVMNTFTAVREGKNVFNLNTSQFPDGIYFFEIENNGELIRSKFMVSK